MKYTYDSEVDAAYILIRRGIITHTAAVDDSRFVDYAKGKAVGIELLNVKQGVLVSGLPYEEDVAALLEKLGVKILRSERWLDNLGGRRNCIRNIPHMSGITKCISPLRSERKAWN